MVWRTTKKEKRKGASAVKLEEGEIYRDDLDGDASEEEVSFAFEGDGKNGHDFENYKYILTLNYGEHVKQFEILGGYEATWIIRTKSGGTICIRNRITKTDYIR